MKFIFKIVILIASLNTSVLAADQNKLYSNFVKTIADFQFCNFETTQKGFETFYNYAKTITDSEKGETLFRDADIAEASLLIDITLDGSREYCAVKALKYVRLGNIKNPLIQDWPRSTTFANCFKTIWRLSSNYGRFTATKSRNQCCIALVT
ncbi:MAG: hypothetical protein OCD03_05610 [Hyphomicrobiales bacterium]